MLLVLVACVATKIRAASLVASGCMIRIAWVLDIKGGFGPYPQVHCSFPMESLTTFTTSFYRNSTRIHGSTWVRWAVLYSMLRRAKRNPNPKKIRKYKVPVSVCLAVRARVSVCVCARVCPCVPVCVKIDGPYLDIAPGNLQEAPKTNALGVPNHPQLE